MYRVSPLAILLKFKQHNNLIPSSLVFPPDGCSGVSPGLLVGWIVFVGKEDDGLDDVIYGRREASNNGQELHLLFLMLLS